MKGKVVFILAGVVSLHLVLLGGICLTGGCKSGGEKAPEQPPAPPAPAPGKPLSTEIPPFSPNGTGAFKGPSDTPPPFRMDSGKMSSVAPAGDSAASHYTVKNGDSLWKVAKKYGISTASLAAANNMSADKGLKIGQTLNIPAGAKAVTEDKAPVKAATSGKKAVVTKSNLAASAEPTKESSKKTASTETSSDSGTYIVKNGDTLAKIASKNHIKLETLAKANGIDSKKQLKAGQKIIIPKSGTSVTAKNEKPAKDKTEKTEKSDKAEKTEKSASKKDPKKESKKDIAAAKPDGKTDASAAPAAKPGSKLDANAKNAIDNLNKSTTEPSDDGMEDLDKETAKVKADNASSKPAEAKTASKSSSVPETVEISEDTTLQAFAARYNVKVDDLRKVNADLPSNGKLTSGMIIVLP